MTNTNSYLTKDKITKKSLRKIIVPIKRNSDKQTIKRSSESSNTTITIMADDATGFDVLCDLMNSNRTNRKTLKNDPKRTI